MLDIVIRSKQLTVRICAAPVAPFQWREWFLRRDGGQHVPSLLARSHRRHCRRRRQTVLLLADGRGLLLLLVTRLLLLLLLLLMLLLLLLRLPLLLLVWQLDRTFCDRRERRDPRNLRGETDECRPDPAARVRFLRLRRDVDGDVRDVNLRRE